VCTSAPTSSTTPIASRPMRRPVSMGSSSLYGHRSLPQIQARRLAMGRGSAEQAFASSARIDALFVEVRAEIEKRNAALRDLDRLKISSSSYLQRLMSKGVMAAAMRAAGLANHVNIEHVSPSQVSTLSETSAGLSKIAKEAA
jgi:hypothetical protein